MGKRATSSMDTPSIVTLLIMIRPLTSGANPPCEDLFIARTEIGGSKEGYHHTE